MAEFKVGDKVLVDINGVDVPGTVSYSQSEAQFMDVDFGNLEVGIDKAFVKHDLKHKVWRVGDVVANAEEAKTLKYDTVIKDGDDDIGQFYFDNKVRFTNDTYAYELSDSVMSYPWEILWVPDPDADTD